MKEQEKYEIIKKLVELSLIHISAEENGAEGEGRLPVYGRE